MQFKLLAGAAALSLHTPLLLADDSASLQKLIEQVQKLEARSARQEAEINRLRTELSARPASAPQTQQEPVSSPQTGSFDQSTQTPASIPAADPATVSQSATGPLDAPGLQPLNLPGLGQAGSTTAATAFNPALSVILDGVYYHDDRQGGVSDWLAESPGFGAGTSEGHAHGGELKQGFNLRETELAFSASVDPYLDALAILAVGEEGLEVEEAYGRTRSLPWGLQLKFGRFFSDIGYMNRQHPHQWDFVDQALPYQLLFGGSLRETGLQLSWLPAWPFYARFGVEALQGENNGVASYLGPDEDHPAFSDKAGPRLFTAFAKFSPDLGYSHALQAGVFGGRALKHQEFQPGATDDEALDGDSWFAGTDWVYKYDDPRAFGQGDLTLQGEYIYRRKDLRVVDSTDLARLGLGHEAAQDGLYVQGVYGFAPRWTTGLRFDTAGLINQVNETGPGEQSLASIQRYTANLTWNPTEFSRLRLQYNIGRLPLDGSKESFNQVYLQYQLSLGAHGAHAF